MQLIRCAAVGLTVTTLACAANASDALAARYACVACHQAERKLVGPSWKEIAAKYADGSKSASQLADAIRRGSTGVWGSIPMPAQPAVNDADRQSLATWVLDQKPAKP
jgi:cytochrome c